MSQEQDALDLLLKQYASTQHQTLPPLLEEPSRFTVQLQEWLDKIFSPLLHWLNDVLSQYSKGSAKMNLPWKTLAIMAILLLLGALVFFILRRVFWNGQATAGNPGKRTNHENSPFFSFDWKKALASNDFALAARLYWRHFLQQKNRPLSQTPLEYYGENNQALLSMYALMFAQNPNQEMFEQFYQHMQRGQG